MGLRITTWNVNGIRNPFSYQPWRDKRSFVAMFDILEADIVVLQETKIQRKDLRDDMVLVPGWDCYFSLPKHEKGKFGVVIYTRQSACAPIRAEEGITGVLCSPNSLCNYGELPEEQQIGGYPTEEQAREAPDAPECATDFITLDSEGRCVILEFPAFVLIGVYNPATRDEARTAFRVSFLNLLDIRVRNLVAMGKRVILTGDLNISKAEIDVANCEADLRKAGTDVETYFSRPPRRMFNQLVDDGTIWGQRDQGRELPVLHDLCRAFHPNRKGMFTCWETKINARPGNYGARIDYVLCSIDMKDWFSESNIQEGLMGSDHCPVYAVMKDTVSINGEKVNIHDVMNPPGMFSEGRRRREYSTKDMQPLSGKLIPEFNGRRSIKDMFSKKPTQSNAVTSNGSEPASDPRPELDVILRGPTQSQDLFLTQHGGDLPTQNEVTAHPRTVGVPSRTIVKRSTSDKSPKRAPKRMKSQSGSTASTTTPTKGQQSLMGFLKPKVARSTELTAEHLSEASVFEQPSSIATEVALSNAGLEEDLSGQSNQVSDPATLSPLRTNSSRPLSQPDEASEDTTVYDPIQSKESWSKLFTKPAAPLCEGHMEPCKVMTTKKPGPNCGRSFWMCAKPLGPSGQKEKNTEWRCGTFIWCSDHKGP